MRKELQIGEILVRQLPAIMGYDTLTTIRDMLNRIDSTVLGDIFLKAKAEEVETLYQGVSFDCSVQGQALLGNEDLAFSYATELYHYIYRALMFNFKAIWDADCVVPNHKPEFTMDKTKLLNPFFSGVISENMASLEDLETKYTVIDVAKMNELLVVDANNQYMANKKASSSQEGSARPGSLASAMANRR